MSGVVLQHLDRLLARLGREDLHLLALEDAGHREDVADVVVDDQHFLPGQDLRRSACSFSMRSPLLRRQLADRRCRKSEVSSTSRSRERTALTAAVRQSRSSALAAGFAEAHLGVETGPPEFGEPRTARTISSSGVADRRPRASRRSSTTQSKAALAERGEALRRRRAASGGADRRFRSAPTICARRSIRARPGGVLAAPLQHAPDLAEDVRRASRGS